MKKKHVFKPLALAAAGMATLLASSAPLAASLMFADSFPPSNTLSSEGTVYWMDRVEAHTDGGVDFRYFPNEQLAKEGEILQKINDGVVQAGYIGIGYVSDEMPLNGATMLPGEVDDVVEASQAYWSALQADTPLRQEFLDNGVVPVFAVLLPPYQLLLNRPPVEDMAGLEGLKLRSSGSLNMVVETVRANPVSMAAPDTYLAIQRGTLDGALFPVTSIAPYKLQEVSKSLSRNAAFGSFGITVAMDRDVYEGLSEAQKQAIAKAGDETVAHLSKTLADDVADDLARFEEAGVTVYELPEAMQQALAPKYRAAQQRWIERMDDRGLDGQAALEAFESRLGDGA
ncbi:TRAP transporter substrate-binding protein DctP [Salinisphaera orenii]|nr:TRAP transporter substrate-binding protein DctP [Salinisphaera orenii]